MHFGRPLAHFGSPLAPFWLPFGSLLAPFWLPLAPFGSLLAPFGSLWLTFLLPLAHFLLLLAHFYSIFSLWASPGVVFGPFPIFSKKYLMKNNVVLCFSLNFLLFTHPLPQSTCRLIEGTLPLHSARFSLTSILAGPGRIIAAGNWDPPRACLAPKRRVRVEQQCFLSCTVPFLLVFLPFVCFPAVYLPYRR